jgi:site-specific recombinase XerC
MSAGFKCRQRRSRVTAHGDPHPAAPLRDAPIGTGYDIRTIQELLGQNDVATTMIDTHVLNKGGAAAVVRGEHPVGAGLKSVLLRLCGVRAVLGGVPAARRRTR